MNKRKFVFVLAIVLLVGCLWGCSATNGEMPKETKAPVVLTDRQKQILTDNNLPADYDQLPLSQQEAIMAIEEMLSYAENKYGIPFSYAGYASAGPIEKEHMRAYPSSGFMATDCFTITKTDGGYEDDYITVACTDLFTAYLTDVLSTLCPDAAVKVYTNITSVSLDAVPEDPADFDGNIGSFICIFVDGSTCDEEAFSQLMTDFKDYLYAHKLYGCVRFNRMKADTLEHLTRFNYTDYFSDADCDVSEMFYVQD